MSLIGILAVRWFLGPLSYSLGTPGGLFAPLLLVPMLAAAAAAMVAATLLKGEPIYDTLRGRLPDRQPAD